jgi:hypothetical protein
VSSTSERESDDPRNMAVCAVSPLISCVDWGIATMSASSIPDICFESATMPSTEDDVRPAPYWEPRGDGRPHYGSQTTSHITCVRCNFLFPAFVSRQCQGLPDWLVQHRLREERCGKLISRNLLLVSINDKGVHGIGNHAAR